MENTKTRKEIALEMAKYFNSKVTPLKLSSWIGDALYYVSEYKTDPDKDLFQKSASYYISIIARTALCGLIKANDGDLQPLADELIPLYEIHGYTDTQRILLFIGKAYLDSLNDVSNTPDIIEGTLSIYSALLTTCEMYKEYESAILESKKAA